MEVITLSRILQYMYVLPTFSIQKFYFDKGNLSTITASYIKGQCTVHTNVKVEPSPVQVQVNNVSRATVHLWGI